MMLNGIGIAMGSVVYTLFLLAILTYVFAILMRNLVSHRSEIEETYFPSVPQSMISLMIFATFLDDAGAFLIDVEDESLPCFLLSWVYIPLASMALLNMLVGIMCEVVTEVATVEKESVQVEQIKSRFKGLADRAHHPDTLTWHEFQQICQDPDAIQDIQDVGVDIDAMFDLAEELFFVDGTEHTATVEEFMEMVLDARGGQAPTVKDIMHFRKRLQLTFSSMKMKMK